jgi:hypothetical protein
LLSALRRRARAIRPAWLRAIRRGGRSALRSAGRGPIQHLSARFRKPPARSTPAPPWGQR